MKTLMVVSGGDAPGINMVLAHFTALAVERGDQVVGAVGGFAGLLNGHIVPLSVSQLAPWSVMPGSMIESSREPVLNKPNAREQLLDILAGHAVDNLVLFGGNGSLKYILPLLREWGIACIGLPTTIDNDVPGTQRSLGFDSACNYAYQAIDGIAATAHALPGRIFLVETLGGDSGMLALEVALASQAHAVLLKEYDYSDTWLGQRLKQRVDQTGFALCVVCEGARNSRGLAEKIPTWINIRVRDIRLGHAQRGAKPTHADRALAVRMARIAYQSLCSGTRVGVVVVRNSEATLHPSTLEGFPAPLPDRATYDFINGVTG